MNSMTGYGKGVAAKDGFSVIIELKSVNHRFLDLTTKLPRSFLFAEETVKRKLTDAFARGHVDVYFNVEDNREVKREISINLALAEQYFEAGKKLSESLGVDNDFTASALMKIQDVVSSSDAVLDEKTLLALVAEACDNAVLALKTMRAAEGERLAADLKSKLAFIEARLDEVRLRAPEVTESYRTKLTARISEVLSGVEIDQTRLLNEVAFFADKCCIDEEITRLASHLKEAEGYFSFAEPVGKKFDFLVQEMNREINTMGSKSNDSALTATVLSMKNELEKVREQIQNIE